MKLQLFCFFSLLSFLPLSAQVAKKSVVISFDQTKDSIINIRGENSRILIKNDLYISDLKLYNNLIAKREKEKTKEKTAGKYTIRPQIYKPLKFYTYYIIANIENPCLNNYFERDMYDRSNLKTLTGAKNIIFIIYKDALGEKHCYEVSQFDNIME